MKTLQAKDLKQMLDRGDNLVLLNVLSEDAFEKEHVPGSLNAPSDREQFVAEVEKQVGDKDRHIVVYCSDQQCDASPTAARKLEEAGFKKVTHFAGGMAEWKAAGFKTESGQPVSR